MTATVATIGSLLEQVARIRPIIEERSADGEEQRRLADPVYDAMIGAGLFRLTVPKALDGLELHPVETYRVWEAVARIDTAAGWNLALNSIAPVFVSMGSQQLADEVFAHGPDVVEAGSFLQPGIATRADGGWRVTGRGRFASGSNRADWIGHAVIEMEGGQPKLDPETGAPSPLLAMFPKAESEVLDTWHTLGMRGTGSNDVAVTDAFLPHHRMIAPGPIASPLPGFEGPLYRLGFLMGLHGETIASLGAASGAIDKLVELATTKVPSGGANLLRDREMAQHHAAKAQALLDASRAYLHSSISDAYRDAEAGTVSMEAKVACQLAACHAAEACAEAVLLVHQEAGTSGVLLESGLDRHIRDALTLTQHASKSYQRYESVGKHLFGLPHGWFIFDL